MLPHGGTSTSAEKAQPKSRISIIFLRSQRSLQRQPRERIQVWSIAALLHDAIEDCEVPQELIVDAFGADVAGLVAEVTDDKSLPKAERKEMQAKTAQKGSPRAKIIKLADKTSNLRALVARPAPDWSVRRRVEYLQWARKVVEGLGKTNTTLDNQFDEAARVAQQSLLPTL
jgi:GTP diphosphokinase / guanosine-3',5'-bis(diphosphate) 3'-diphosphatase